MSDLDVIGRVIMVGEDRSVWAARTPNGKSFAFRFRNGEGVVDLVLSPEAVEAMHTLTTTKKGQRRGETFRRSQPHWRRVGADDAG